MATISSLGIGSGLDVESIVGKLVALEKQPLATLMTKQATINTRMSVVGQIQSQVSALADAAGRLSQASAWTGMTASSSNASAVGVTVTGTAAATSFNVAVQQLAAAQSTASSPVTAGTTFGAGTLSISIGTWDHVAVPPTFSQGTAATVDVNVGAADTLDTIAASINAAKAGVTATVLNDASGQRLLVRSDATGAASGFRIQSAGAAGLGALAFDRAAGDTGMAANAYQQAANTLATVNGVSVTSANNQITGAITGLTLNVSAVTATPALVTVSADTATMRKNISDFMTAYNSLSKTLSDATKYDPATKAAGPLQGDTVIVGLQNALRRLFGASAATGGAFSRLADIGLDMKRGGVLTQDSAKLDAAMQKLGDLQKLFTASNTDPTTNGFGLKIKDFATGLLNAGGAVTNQNTALQGQLKRNTQEQDRVNARAAQVEKRLRHQYGALDTQMASMSALGSYVGQQISLWNKSSQ